MIIVWEMFTQGQYQGHNHRNITRSISTNQVIEQSLFSSKYGLQNQKNCVLWSINIWFLVFCVIVLSRGHWVGKLEH